MRMSYGLVLLIFLAHLPCWASPPYLAYHPIHEAAFNGDLPKVKELLQKDPKLVNQPLGVSHFTLCNSYQQGKRVEFADPSCTRWVDETPVYRAAIGGRLDVVKYLVEHGANVNSGLKEAELPYPLYGAVYSGNTEIAQYLLDHGANVNALGEPPGPWRWRGSALHRAAGGEHKLQMAKFLLEHGANLNMQDEENATPLHRAVKSANLDVVKLFLVYGADLTLKNKDGQRPLDLAAAAENKDASSLRARRHEIAVLLSAPVTDDVRRRLAAEVELTLQRVAGKEDKLLATLSATPERNSFLAAARALAEARDERMLEIVDHRLFDFDPFVRGELAPLISLFPTDKGRSYARKWLELSTTNQQKVGEEEEATYGPKATQTLKVWAAVNLLGGDASDNARALSVLNSVLPDAGGELPYDLRMSAQKLYQALAAEGSEQAQGLACRIANDRDENRDLLGLVKRLYADGCRSALAYMLRHLDQSKVAGTETMTVNGARILIHPQIPSTDYFIEDLGKKSLSPEDGQEWFPPGFSYSRQDSVDDRIKKREQLKAWLSSEFDKIIKNKQAKASSE